jgi:hypothetical protein
MSVLKVGQKLGSNACDTQIMIIKAPGGEHVLECGGVEMSAAPAAEKTSLDPARAEGTLLGKRYVNEDESVELLCVKPGAGSLYLDGVPLGPKQAKALPSSD